MLKKTAKARGTKRVLTTLRLDHLSGVDRPAQEPATTRAIKSSSGDPAMPKTPAEYDAEILDLQKKLKRAESLAAMSDAHKAFMRGLDPDERPDFITKSAADRDQVIKAAEAADPIVYTSKRTTKSYRQSQAELADMAKQADEAHETSQEVAKAAKAERIAKRASDLANLSNDKGGLTALLEVVDGLPTDVKKSISSTLDAVNAQAGDFQGAHGTKKNVQAGDTSAARAEYETYVADVAKSRGISVAEAKLALVSEGDKKAKQLQKAWREAGRK